MFHDGAGNLATVRTHGDGWRYDEATTRNVQYRETAKDIRNSSGKGVSFSGHTSFSHDANGNLVSFDRGRYRNEFTGEAAQRNSVASFTYDNDGQILTRSETAANDLAPTFLEGSDTDPELVARGSAGVFNPYGQQGSRWNALNAALAGTFKLNGYFYGQGHPLADQSGDQVRALRKLTLQGATPRYDAPAPCISPAPTIPRPSTGRPSPSPSSPPISPPSPPTPRPTARRRS